MRRPGLRILAAALGAYLALSLGRTAGLLWTETRRGEALRRELAAAEARLASQARAGAMTEEELRAWARRQGLVSPEDVVFFDLGAERGENKGG